MNTVPESPGLLKTRDDAERLAASFPGILLEAEKIIHALLAGLHGRKRAGTGETFWQHRPYIFGDAISDIDWRQSARVTGQPLIRQNEWEAAASIWLWRDPSQSMVYSSNQKIPEKIYRSNILATAFAILLSQTGERVGVLSQGANATQTERLYHGRSTPTKILENLYHHHDTQTEHMPRGEKLRPGNHVILFSDLFIDPQILSDAIGRYSAKGASGSIIQILDPAESDFPFKGRTEFIDTETPERLLFGNAKSLQQNYQDELARHQEAIQNITKKSGWALHTHLTNMSATAPLLFLINHMSDKKFNGAS